MTREEAREVEAAAAKLLQRASATLDLSQIPPALRGDVSVAAVLQLKEIFDRMLLPPLDALPSARMVAAARKEAGESASKGARPFRWRMPNTQIEIVEIVEGERLGQFLFSAATVRRIGDVYKLIEDLPYRQEQFGGTELDYRSPDLSPGFYKHYVSASGQLIPRAHFLGRVVDALPASFRTVHGGQLVWQWIAFLLCVLLTVTVAYAAYRYIRLSAGRVQSPLHDWLRVLAPIIVLFFVMGAGHFIDRDLNFTGELQVVVTTVVAVIVLVLTAWVAFVFSQAAAETLIAAPRMQGKSSESALVRIGAWVLGFLAGVWIVVDGIRALGADLLPLLAGLGIGGFAVALAAQSTIANFIGGLILLANKPVRVGDFCRYGEDPSSDWLRVGTVEEINWMSTRIRGIDRTVTTIPNAAFSTIHIVNLSKRDQRLVKTTLQLRYETTPEQMRYVLAKLRALLLGHPMVTSEPARVRFVGYSAYSKDVEIFCYLRCTEQNEFLAVQEDLLLRMEDIVKEAGSGFAFPSQTAYLARDTGVDAEKAADAEAQVDRWRAGGRLPFPEFDDQERKRLGDVLDYPPRGSPGYQPRPAPGTPAPDDGPKQTR
jgi:MscS family membrane protein